MGALASKPVSKPVTSQAASGKPYACNPNDILWLDAPTNSRYVTMNNRRATCLTKCGTSDQPEVVMGKYTGNMRASNGGIYTPTQYFPCPRYATDPLCPKIDISCKVNAPSGPAVNLPGLIVR